MMELFSLKQLSNEQKVVLLGELGYKTDGVFVLNTDDSKVLDKYLSIPIKLDKMVIFPGSTIILDDNEVSINLFLEEYGDIL